ncbi:MAG: cyclic peptide export ABC transporter [Bacteroidota bacterium]
MFKLTFKNVLYLILYSIPNTLLTFGILYIINNALAGQAGFLDDYMVIVFVSLIVYCYLLNILFQKGLIRYTHEILYENEKRIFKEMMSTPLAVLEKYGPQRFYTAVEDLRVFAGLPEAATHTINSLMMVLLCVFYLFTLSVYAALIVVVLIIVLAVVYFLVINTMSHKIADLRMYNEHYYQYVQDLIKGFKELKINKLRRKNLLGKYLNPNREGAKQLDFLISFIFLSINFISQYGLYMVIAAILFILPEMGLLEREDVIAYVVVLLFISGPINNLINMQNIYTRFLIANRRIKTFLEDFKNTDPYLGVETVVKDFNALEFDAVQFSYVNDEKEANFTLGPINLRIEQGETIFVVGGNGSGKSTFINTLTGMYPPTQGKIILNDQTEINTVAAIQDLTAAIFTDNHIFSHNYDDYTVVDNPDYPELLQTMKMDQVITDDTEASARRKFSKGQSKRVSMIFALLEEKPLLVLDEWAADQDPHFRRYFYEELLPQLKAAGKTIIAVTHDDAYFKHADRIIKFDYGKIVKDIPVREEEMLARDLWYTPQKV